MEYKDEYLADNFSIVLDKEKYTFKICKNSIEDSLKKLNELRYTEHLIKVEMEPEFMMFLLCGAFRMDKQSFS